METYVYKVIYPGGVFVRLSPSQEAEKTDIILEYGTTFEASKSLIMDGVNYVKLADGSGWVFGNKGNSEILELMEVIRTPMENAYTGGDNLSFPKVGGELVSPPMSPLPKLSIRDRTKDIHKARTENRYWKDVRNRSAQCQSFAEYLKLACNLEAHPPSIPEPGPARSAWMAESKKDQQKRNIISTIASITRQCAEIADMTGLESSLWLAAHLGPKMGHLMELVQEAANKGFESVSEKRKSELLYVALEVSSRTKGHCNELGRLADMLPDDFRNFLQRWIIIKAFDENPVTPVPLLDDDDDVIAEDATDSGAGDKDLAAGEGASANSDYGVGPVDISQYPGSNCTDAASGGVLGMPTATATPMDGRLDRKGWHSEISLHNNEEAAPRRSNQPPTSGWFGGWLGIESALDRLANAIPDCRPTREVEEQLAQERRRMKEEHLERLRRQRLRNSVRNQSVSEVMGDYDNNNGDDGASQTFRDVDGSIAATDAENRDRGSPKKAGVFMQGLEKTIGKLANPDVQFAGLI
jgi:hypothetical protein